MRKPELVPTLDRSTQTTIRFTLDLTPSLHRKLSRLAARQLTPKVTIVRAMLEEWLRDIED